LKTVSAPDFLLAIVTKEDENRHHEDWDSEYEIVVMINVTFTSNIIVDIGKHRMRMPEVAIICKLTIEVESKFCRTKTKTTITEDFDVTISSHHPSIDFCYLEQKSRFAPTFDRIVNIGSVKSKRPA
jgi:hypothetical protein